MPPNAALTIETAAIGIPIFAPGFHSAFKTLIAAIGTRTGLVTDMLPAPAAVSGL